MKRISLFILTFILTGQVWAATQCVIVNNSNIPTWNCVYQNQVAQDRIAPPFTCNIAGNEVSGEDTVYLGGFNVNMGSNNIGIPNHPFTVTAINQSDTVFFPTASFVELAVDIFSNSPNLTLTCTQQQ